MSNRRTRGRAEGVTALDAVYWHASRRPILSAANVALFFVDGPIERSRLIAGVESIVAGVPRMRQVVEHRAGRLRWVEHRVEVGAHVVEANVRSTGANDHLFELAAREMVADLPPGRPLWRLTYLDGLPDGGAAVVWTMHHSVADGVRGGEAMEGFLGVGPDGAEPLIDPPVVVPEADVTGAMAGPRAGAAFSVRREVAELRSAQAVLSPSAGRASPLLARRSPHRLLASVPVPFEDLQRARQHGATVNDVFVTLLQRALASYHRCLGHRAEEFVVRIPVNRVEMTGVGAEGNHHSLFTVALPVGDGAFGDDLRSVSAALAEGKQTALTGAARRLLRLGSALPPRLVARQVEVTNARSDYIASNVVGSPAPLWIGNRQIVRMCMFPATFGCAFAAALYSYAGNAEISLTIDREAVRAPDVLARSVREAVGELAIVSS